MASAILHKKVQENRSPLLFPAAGQCLKGIDLSAVGAKCKKALDKIANIAPWTLHDLRRTFRANLAA